MQAVGTRDYNGKYTRCLQKVSYQVRYWLKIVIGTTLATLDTLDSLVDSTGKQMNEFCEQVI